MTGLTIPFTGLRKQYNNLRQEILDVTDEVLRSGQLMGGNYTAEFENWLAKKNGVKYAVTCHSGTHALEIMAEYYATEQEVPNPPRVLIPSLTYAATANAFMRAGWEIDFCDTDEYGVLDVEKMDITRSYQAVVIVGLYGAAIKKRIDEGRGFKFWALHDFFVLEDGAQHWLSDNSHRIGSSCAISFDPMKNLNAYGNGGAIVTNDANLLHFARSWRDNGKLDNHQSTGTNSRMSEIDCAQMMVKTRYIDEWQKRRGQIARYWMERLSKSEIRSLIDKTNIDTHCFHKFVIDVEDRNQLQLALANKKIETKIHYPHPLHEMGTFRQWHGPDILSRSSALSRRVLSLPIYPELTDLEVEYIIDQVKDCAST